MLNIRAIAVYMPAHWHGLKPGHISFSISNILHQSQWKCSGLNTFSSQWWRKSTKIFPLEFNLGELCLLRLFAVALCWLKCFLINVCQQKCISVLQEWFMTVFPSASCKVKKKEKNQKSLGLGWEMILVTVKGKTTVDYWNLETAVSRPKPPNSVRKLPRDN